MVSAGVREKGLRILRDAETVFDAAYLGGEIRAIEDEYDLEVHLHECSHVSHAVHDKGVDLGLLIRGQRRRTPIRPCMHQLVQ